jgi:hypothetical protein
MLLVQRLKFVGSLRCETRQTSDEAAAVDEPNHDHQPEDFFFQGDVGLAHVEADADECRKCVAHQEGSAEGPEPGLRAQRGPVDDVREGVATVAEMALALEDDAYPIRHQKADDERRDYLDHQTGWVHGITSRT